MSPILVRPVREQLEHDRLIRFLAGKFKKRYDVSFNLGEDRSAVVRSGTMLHYPDVVLCAPDKGRKLLCVIEVETGESVNHLEALAQWAPLSRARAPFHLYIPSGTVDQARRLCADNHVNVSEIWTYHSIIDELRVSLAYRAPQAATVKVHRTAVKAKASRAGASRTAARSGRKAKPPAARKKAAAKGKTTARAKKKPVRKAPTAKPSRRTASRGGRRAPARRTAPKVRRSSKRR